MPSQVRVGVLLVKSMFLMHLFYVNDSCEGSYEMVSGDSVDVTLAAFGITSLPSRRMKNIKIYEYIDIFLQLCLSC